METAIEGLGLGFRVSWALCRQVWALGGDAWRSHVLGFQSLTGVCRLGIEDLTCWASVSEVLCVVLNW